MTSNRFNLIPNETLANIVEQLRSNPSSLFSLSQTCKRCKEATENQKNRFIIETIKNKLHILLSSSDRSTDLDNYLNKLSQFHNRKIVFVAIQMALQPFSLHDEHIATAKRNDIGLINAHAYLEKHFRLLGYITPDFIYGLKKEFLFEHQKLKSLTLLYALEKKALNQKDDFMAIINAAYPDFLEKKDEAVYINKMLFSDYVQNYRKKFNLSERDVLQAQTDAQRLLTDYDNPGPPTPASRRNCILF